MQKPNFHLHQQKDHWNFLRLLVPELSVLCKGAAVIENVIECNEPIFAFISKRQLKRNTVAALLTMVFNMATFYKNL
jgi:hypothetical protein